MTLIVLVVPCFMCVAFFVASFARLMDLKFSLHYQSALRAGTRQNTHAKQQVR
jgi:hypothetical protein